MSMKFCFLTLSMLAVDLSAQGIAYANSLNSNQVNKMLGLTRDPPFDYLIKILQKRGRQKSCITMSF